jgi:DNA-binding transcriptional regulator YhcF (GntR family)
VSLRKTVAGREGISRGSELNSLAEHEKTSFERLRIRIDRADPASGGEQIAYRIASFVVDGVLRDGGRMPTLDIAARHVGVNRGVMAAAYQILARFGISTNSTGSGTYLTSNAEHAARRYLCSVSARTLVHQARLLDLGDEEIIGVVLACFESDEKRTAPDSDPGDAESR